MAVLPVLLLLLFLFVAARLVQLALDPSARANTPSPRAVHRLGTRTAP
jgi:hypothetical protein